MRYEEVKEMKDLERGDQIAVSGNVKDLHPLLVPFTMHTDNIYFHHGIFDKENLAVYDLSGDSKANARPRRRDFTEFYAGHSKLYRVVYEDGEQCLPVNEVMKRAEDAVKQQSSWPGYHIITNNCESFVTFLKTGYRYSEQAIKALKEAAPVAVALISSVAGSPAAGAAIAFGSITDVITISKTNKVKVRGSF